MIKKKKLFYLNPASSHQVFIGWRYFFDKYFDSYIVSHDNISDFGNHILLAYKKLIRIGKNFIVFYDKKKLPIEKDDFVLIGDIFTNTLCYTLRKGKKIYYSEFFLHKKSFWKRAFFRIMGLLFFHNKKFVLPTKLAYNTISKISSKCLYLPTLYKGEIVEPVERDDTIIKFLFIGRISNAYKNIHFMIDNYLQLKRIHKNISLTLVGEMFDKDFYSRYEKELKNDEIVYLGKKDHKEVLKIYSDYDVFVLASNSDPIGVVIQEAMAHGCAILVSDTCGAECYIENGKNGYVFETNNAKNFLEKAELIIKKQKKLFEYKKHSIKLIKETYFCENEKLMDSYYKKLIDFITK